MQKQVQTFAVGLFVLGVDEAFKLKRLLKKEKKTEKFGQPEVGGHPTPPPSWRVGGAHSPLVAVPQPPLGLGKCGTALGAFLRLTIEQLNQRRLRYYSNKCRKASEGCPFSASMGSGRAHLCSLFSCGGWWRAQARCPTRCGGACCAPR